MIYLIPLYFLSKQDYETGKVKIFWLLVLYLILIPYVLMSFSIINIIITAISIIMLYNKMKEADLLTLLFLGLISYWIILGVLICHIIRYIFMKPKNKALFPDMLIVMILFNLIVVIGWMY